MTVSDAELMDAIDSCRRRVRRRYRDQPYCEDLEQEAAIGVLRAAEDYDPDRGASFRTYAHWWAYARSGRLSEKERAARYGLTHGELVGKTARPPAWRNAFSLNQDYYFEDGDPVEGLASAEPASQEEEEDARRVRCALAHAAERIARRSSKMSGTIAWRLAALMASEGEADGGAVAKDVGCTRQNVNRVRRLLLDETRSILGVWES